MRFRNASLIVLAGLLLAVPKAFSTDCQDPATVPGGSVNNTTHCSTGITGVLSWITIHLFESSCTLDKGQKPSGTKCVAGSSFRGGTVSYSFVAYIVDHNACVGGDCVSAPSTTEFEPVPKCNPGSACVPPTIIIDTPIISAPRELATIVPGGNQQ